MTAAIVAFSMKLSCGHEIRHGYVSLLQVGPLTPRRKDGSFGSVRCPYGRHGRRRVTFTQTTFTGATHD